MTVNYNTYNEEKKVFFNKHHNDFRCDTSSMDEYGRYWKHTLLKMVLSGMKQCHLSMCPKRLKLRCVR